MNWTNPMRFWALTSNREQDHDTAERCEIQLMPRLAYAPHPRGKNSFRDSRALNGPVLIQSLIPDPTRTSTARRASIGSTANAILRRNPPWMSRRGDPRKEWEFRRRGRPRGRDDTALLLETSSRRRGDGR